MDMGGSEQKVTRGKCRRIFGAHSKLAANLKISETRRFRRNVLVTKKAESQQGSAFLS